MHGFVAHLRTRMAGQVVREGRSLTDFTGGKTTFTFTKRKGIQRGEMKCIRDFLTCSHSVSITDNPVNFKCVSTQIKV